VLKISISSLNFRKNGELLAPHFVFFGRQFSENKKIFRQTKIAPPPGLTTPLMPGFLKRGLNLGYVNPRSEGYLGGKLRVSSGVIATRFTPG